MGNILGLTVTGSISAITVFFQGLLSFFSPCVLPLIPLYIGYLSGGTQSGSDTDHGFSRVKMIINTIFFVAGVVFSFFLLGLGMRAVGRFFSGNQELFADIGQAVKRFRGTIDFQKGAVHADLVDEVDAHRPGAAVPLVPDVSEFLLLVHEL